MRQHSATGYRTILSVIPSSIRRRIAILGPDGATRIRVSESNLLILPACIFVSTRSKIRFQKDKEVALKYGITFCVRTCLAIALLACLSAVFPAFGQDSPFPQATELKPEPPLSNQELVAMLYESPRHPAGRERR